MAGFAGAHVALALVMHALPIVATMHALACVVVGVYVAARRPPQDIAVVVAYMAACEVLWRMSQAAVFWEFGKYAIAVVLVVALLRIRIKRNAVVPMLYFALLLPSALLTLLAFSADAARQQLSFNLSGPLALALSALFFSNVRLSRARLRMIFGAVLGPVIGIASVAYFSTTRSQDIEFTHASNIVTSGGFGPNQVSAMLGLGVLICFLLLIERELAWRIRGPLLGLAVLLATQAALTFSRGGIVLPFVAAAAAMFYLLRDARARVTLVVVATMLFAVGRYVVVPRLEEFTAGKLAERYTKSDTSGRTLLASYDMKIFAENPVLGVGPGAAAPMRGDLGHFGAAHTEFTRMLAEHGILGAIALLLLIIMGVRAVVDARGVRMRAFVVALVIWVALFLLINAMRLAAPCVVFGLACSIAYSTQRVSRGAGLLGLTKPDTVQTAT